MKKKYLFEKLQDLFEDIISWIAKKDREYNAWCWHNREFF